MLQQHVGLALCYEEPQPPAAVPAAQHASLPAAASSTACACASPLPSLLLRSLPAPHPSCLLHNSRWHHPPPLVAPLTIPAPPRPCFPPSGSGPLGLRLRKSPSLLNMINSALSSEPAMQDSGMGLAPMVLC